MYLLMGHRAKFNWSKMVVYRSIKNCLAIRNLVFVALERNNVLELFTFLLDSNEITMY